MRKTDKIAIVGSGTSGLVAALILQVRLNVQIDVISSKNIGIVGVGEGSTEHWKDFLHFLEFVNISPYDFIKRCDATYKCGVMFKDWTDQPYMHSVQIPFDYKYGQYPVVYGKVVSEGLPSWKISSKLFWDNKIDSWFLNKPNETPVNQFHFNTYKLNDYLKELCLNRGIGLVEDEIQDVILDDAGYIKSLKGEIKSHEYDFYIDSSGFKRMLISKLGGKWQSYSKWLRMNSAFAFPTPDTENYNAWTLATAMKAGWMFRIPTYGRWGNGYIYDSNYLSQEDALREVEQMYGHPIEIGKEFKFDPGAIDRPWIKNCVAIGLSGSFFEPMEASSIGTSIQQAFVLMHKLVNYNESVIKQYNKICQDIFENIRDFIALHYIVEKDSSQFWIDQKFVPIPDTLREKLRIWKYKIPIEEDFNSESGYILFKSDNFATVLHGLGLFDKESITKEYMGLQEYVRKDADRVMAEHDHFLENVKAFTHKEMLTKIRELN